MSVVRRPTATQRRCRAASAPRSGCPADRRVPRSRRPSRATGRGSPSGAPMQARDSGGPRPRRADLRRRRVKVAPLKELAGLSLKVVATATPASGSDRLGIEVGPTTSVIDPSRPPARTTELSHKVSRLVDVVHYFRAGGPVRFRFTRRSAKTEAGTASLNHSRSIRSLIGARRAWIPSRISGDIDSMSPSGAAA